MRKRERKAVITFSTTTAAIHMETCCKKEGLPGRLIPVPTAITAGCGLAWALYPEEKEMVLAMMEREGIVPEGVCELEI